MELNRNHERIVIFSRKIGRIKLFEQFLNFCKQIIKANGIESEYLRWSQKDNAFYSELGSRNIQSFKKLKHGYEIQLFLTIPAALKYKEAKDNIHHFKPKQKFCLLLRTITDFNQIDDELIDAHRTAVKEYYQEIKAQNLHKIRENSGTTIKKLFEIIDQYGTLDNMVEEISAMSHDIKVIESQQDLIDNIKKFVEYRESVNSEERNFYKKRVQNGNSYVVDVVEGKLEFAPSRTVGYKNLNRLRYEPQINQEIDGRITNPILEQVIGKRKQSKKIDQALKLFLKNLGINKKIEGRNKSLQYFLTYKLEHRIEPFLNELLTQSTGENIKKMKNSTIKIPLNQILYGPPGTGKTYYLKHRYFDHFTTRESNITEEQHFNEVAAELSWWQAIGLALIELQSAKVTEIMQNRWVNHKIQNSNSKNARATVWGTLQMHTKENNQYVNYKMRQAPLIFDKDENSNWQIDLEEAKQQAPELEELHDSVNNFKPSPDKLIKRYVFTTFHQSFTYEDFIEGIKPVMEDESEGDLRYEIQDGVFKSICKRAEKDLDNDYAIFIDEINRGNVASIFGELITLIEEDKRAGNDEALEVTLPYSKQKFSVPNNLYIIGTMNTADRSVEALDSALRRRFSFEEMMPKPELLDDIEWNGFSISDILATINDRIEVLIDRDHTIGHSYFLKLSELQDLEEELKSIFRDKVIPLLQEYFFNDYGKIQLVLGEGFVEKVEYEKKLFPEIKGNEIDINDYTEKPKFRFKMNDKQFDIKEAIDILLNGKKKEESKKEVVEQENL
jgi:hypothetical protein